MELSLKLSKESNVTVLRRLENCPINPLSEPQKFADEVKAAVTAVSEVIALVVARNSRPPFLTSMRLVSIPSISPGTISQIMAPS